MYRWISRQEGLVLARYPDIGGQCCWEWYIAVLADEENGKSVHYPEMWLQMVYKIIHGWVFSISKMTC
ncbi:hypothetical protein CcaCcLH18_10157 [Colletotrichum camelliae]|nr:hypothetical protein CcaCcLH18_10157 [Colletotrichum camelliae]